MAIRLYKEPRLEKLDMVACWPGIGNIGIIAVDTLRGQIQAEELGEIEPWEDMIHMWHVFAAMLPEGHNRQLSASANSSENILAEPTSVPCGDRSAGAGRG